MSADRTFAVGSVAASGVVLIGVVGNALLGTRQSVPGLLIAGLGLLVGGALIAAAVWLHVSEVTARGALRVAGWNLLGIVAIGAAVTVIYAYQAGVGSPVSDPYFSGSVLVGVSAVAHVLIGINDVQRIRAQEVARERLKFSVVSRVVRHDLRTHSQVLLGYADRIADGAGDGGDATDTAERLQGTAADLSGIHEEMKIIQRVVDDPEARERFDLSALVTDVVADLRETYPAATITTDLPSSVAVTVHPDFPAAIREVIDNAIGHHDGDRPEVEVAVRRRSGGGAELVVTDDGPGIPGGQRDLVLGDTGVTQLQHGNGLGLWLVKWVLEASDGELTIEDTAEGTTVRFRLPPAE